LNITVWEELCADAEKVRSAAIAVAHRLHRHTGHTSFLLTRDVTEEQLHELEVAVKEAWYSLVDDYTTPDCECNYCSWKTGSGELRYLCCEVRWNRLSPEERCAIAESVND
jgi:hypothetical protein